MQLKYEKPSVEIIDFYAMRMLASSGTGGGFDSADEGVVGGDDSGRGDDRSSGREG